MRSASTWLKEHNYYVWYYETHPHYIRHSTDERYRDEYPTIGNAQPKYTHQFEPDVPISHANHYNMGREPTVWDRRIIDTYFNHKLDSLTDDELQLVIDSIVQLSKLKKELAS